MFGWRRSLLGLSSACVFGLSYAAHAAEPALGAPMPTVQGCAAPIARVIAIQGEVRVRTQQQAWQLAAIEQALCAGDELQVAAGGRGALRLGATTLPLDQNTHLILRGHSADGKTLQIELVSGNINVATDASSQIQLITPHGKVSTTGGDFAVSVTAQQAALSVFGGKVAVSNPEGNLELLGDETAYFAQLSAPKRDITVKARDSVQWVVQYPALLPSGAAQPSAWAEAARQYEQGRVLDALIALDQVPAAARSADYYNYRANIFLLSGRAADAMADIEQAKKLNPNSAETWALQAIFDLGQNNSAQALAHADKAVKLNPDSPAAQLAHSYALQANRRQEDALVSARRMVALAPDNALGHTRVAELQLARGDHAASLRAAKRGVALAPNSADAQSILGFAYLSTDQDNAARSAFDSAVRLNSADPRARMGLGLTRIRQGQLQAGREDLELAASLDPENALLRTYLGRAYAKEGRAQDAAEQYARAKHSDPLDPTAYYFSALLMAENNQPVSAQAQMQEALARNENRAVYRGQVLLEEDRALRQANAVAIQRALGFDDTARAEASAAVADNPQSGVAHRALGDALASLPRADAARRSEYLQAMMDEPLGTPPPSLFLSEGVRRSALAPQHGFFRAAEPGQIGYNEFGAVFNNQAWQGQVGGTLGGQDTSGEQFQLSGKTGNLGWALSQLHFKTDGFGDYNRLDNSVMQGIVQADLTLDTRVYAEALQYNSDRQDIDSAAEPFYYSPLNVSEDRWRYRLGLRQRLGQAHELLALGVWEAYDQIADTQPTLYNGLTEPYHQRRQIKARTPELQYRYQSNTVKAILGGALGYSRSVLNDGSLPLETRSRTTYVYSYLKLPYRLNLELGFAHDNQRDTVSLNQQYTNPKLGLRWEIVPDGTLRLVALRANNRALASSATLEPSQVAGFNQDYGDTFGVRTKLRGVAWDQHMGQNVSWGLEALHRELQVPVSLVYDYWDDRTRRAYFNWALPKDILHSILPGTEASASVVYDSADLTRPGAFIGSELIREYRPRHVRYGALLNHASGLGLNLGATQVNSQGRYEVYDLAYNVIPLPFSDQFWILDAALSYQLPAKRGQIVIGAMNLTNRRNFQYFELDAQNRRFAPERFVYGKLLLNF